MADSYQETLDYLYSFVDYETAHQPRSPVNYDLRRVAELLVRLGDPHLKARTVHIAGTKGKGSTAAMIASALTAAGFKTGLFTSPHLIDLRERIRVNGGLIPRAGLMRLTARLKPEVEAVNSKAAYGRLTTFELLTALGFLYFAENRTDFQVVEVGLGGRLDATNVVRPEVCVITSISLDHTDVLGDTLTEIAAEKAGIIKQGVPVVSALQPPEARGVIEAACRAKNCELTLVGRDVTYRELSVQPDSQSIEVKGRLGSYALELPLLGPFQQANAAAAIGALEVLRENGHAISQQDIVKGIGVVRWPGRFQAVRRNPLVVVDGAHNPASASELARAVGVYAGDKKPKVLVIGSSSDKDYKGMAAVLAPLFDAVIATSSRHPRALEAEAMAAVFRGHVAEVLAAPSVACALDTAVKLAGRDGFVCASGSLFIVGEALEWARLPGH